MNEEERTQQNGVKLVHEYFSVMYPEHMIKLEKKKKIGGKTVKVYYHKAPFFHIENEAKKNFIQQSKSKAMGKISGVPDLFLDMIVGDKRGLRIEVKSQKGRLSYNQNAWKEHYKKNGIEFKICRTADEILHVVREYME